MFINKPIGGELLLYLPSDSNVFWWIFLYFHQIKFIINYTFFLVKLFYT